MVAAGKVVQNLHGSEKKSACDEICRNFGSDTAVGYSGLVLSRRLFASVFSVGLVSGLPVEARRIWGCCHLHSVFVLFIRLIEVSSSFDNITEWISETAI